MLIRGVAKLVQLPFLGGSPASQKITLSDLPYIIATAFVASFRIINTEIWAELVDLNGAYSQ